MVIKQLSMEKETDECIFWTAEWMNKKSKYITDSINEAALNTWFNNMTAGFEWTDHYNKILYLVK